MNTRNSSEKPLSDDEVIARAEGAMARAAEKAMADYKRFGLEPVISNPPNDTESKEQ